MNKGPMMLHVFLLPKCVGNRKEKIRDEGTELLTYPSYRIATLLTRLSTFTGEKNKICKQENQCPKIAKPYFL